MNELLCHADSSQLVVIDIQDRLAAAIPESVRQQLIKNTSLLSKAAALLDVPITYTEQYPKGLGHTNSELKTLLPDPAIAKTSFSCCGSDDFVSRLAASQRQQIVIAGMESHVCVLQTAMQLHQQGYQVFVIEDAICSRTKLNHQNALARLRQTNMTISTTESVLFEWLRDAKHEHFKAISQLLR